MHLIHQLILELLGPCHLLARVYYRSIHSLDFIGPFLPLDTTHNTPPSSESKHYII